MFSSFFSGPTDPNAPNFHSTVEGVPSTDLFGPLEPKDLEWTIGSGFITETQVWYHSLEDGTFLILQIIHSSVGLWYPTVQFTCKIYNPKTGEKTWKSLNVANFVTPPPSTSSRTYDKRSSKSDQFSVIHSTASSSEFAESYEIFANLGTDLQISLTVSRPSTIPGFKLGKGPKGGFSNFGTNVESPEGYVIHRFWPRTTCTGQIMLNGAVLEAKGTGMFVHAIQGMRPNLVAARWNFADFQSDEHAGTSAIQMEFTTIDQYGRKGPGSGGVTVNVGSVVVGGKLVLVTGETVWADEKDVKRGSEAAIMSRATHLDLKHDPETGYDKPTVIRYNWAGPVIGGSGTVKAELTVDVGGPEAPNGLVEKVDVLAEIPKVLKAVVNYVAGTKPYIYQWLNPAQLALTAPGSLIDGSEEEAKTVTVSGVLFNEATFIS